MRRPKDPALRRLHDITDAVIGRQRAPVQQVGHETIIGAAIRAMDRLGAAMDNIQLLVRQFLDSHLRAFRSRCYRVTVLPEVFHMPITRWLKTSDKPNVQTFEPAPYDIEVVQTTIDTAEAEKQLAHARQQIELTKSYPGRR
jgi:hypothetical protein